jgi:hypothetical protein
MSYAQPSDAILVYRLYAYRIWIGICFPIDGFIMTYENTVSEGRSRALPIIVVGLQSLSMLFHSFDALLGRHCNPRVR